MTNRRNKLVAAVAAVLTAGAIGGAAIANAGPTPPPPPPAPTVVDTPEPGDTPDAPGMADAPEPGDAPDVATGWPTSPGTGRYVPEPGAGTPAPPRTLVSVGVGVRIGARAHTAHL